MNGFLKIFLALILFFFISTEINARELCDCYGNCAFIYPRDVKTSVKKFIKIRDGYSAFDEVDIDHKLPLCIGGSNDNDNLQAISPEIHRIKTEHDMLLLYLVENCYMTILEAQTEALNYKAR